MNAPYRFTLEIYDGQGASLGQEPISVDFQPAEEWARFMAIRSGVLPAARPSAQAFLQPIWHHDRGRPYTEGFRVRLQMEHHREATSDFTALYFGELAQQASSRLVERMQLRPGDPFQFIVTAFPKEEREERPRPRFRAEEVVTALPVREAVLRDRMRSASPQGVVQADDIPVFVPRGVLIEATALALEKGAIETGGILVGHLYRDQIAGEIFAGVTTQIPAVHALGDRTSLKFTAEAWTHVQGVLDLRRRDEVHLGWWHSHIPNAWCRNCPIERRRRCPLSTGFFSTQDRSLHRAVFSPAYAQALVVNVIGADEQTTTMFGWRHGTIQQRGFYVVEETA
ncbi:MAG: hypothetical protein O7A63_04140 [Acidobacteria bacterium]|nr:hypothetical protein [Acidobacteriota bacterium]